MLHKLTIGKKLFLIVAVFSTVLVGMTTFMLLDMRSGMIEDRRAKLRALVEAAVNTVNRYGDLAAAGKMPVEEAQKTALAVLDGMNFDGKNYFLVFDRNGILKMHPTRKDDIGHNMLDPKQETSANYIGYLNAANTQAPLEGFSVFIGRRPGSTVNDTPKLFLSSFDKHWGWVVTTGIFLDDVNALFLSRAAWVAGAVVAGLAFSLLLTMLLGRSITRPLNRTVNALEELSAGRFDAEASEDDSKTEIGRLARAFVQFRDKMKETEALRARQLGAEEQAKIDRRNTMSRVADEFDAAVGSVVEIPVRRGRADLADRGAIVEKCRGFGRGNRAREWRSLVGLRKHPDRCVGHRGTLGVGRRNRTPDPHDPRHRAADPEHIHADRATGGSAVGQRRSHRRDHRNHQQHCGTDQPARAQCDHRGRPRRRGRPRVFGSGLRGQGARQPDHQGH